jgi:hypothetical protein
MASAKDNKFLTLGDKAVMTPVIEFVVCALEPFFAEAKLKAIVTSGKREPADQLRIIRQYLVKKGFDKTYPDAMTCSVKEKYTDGNFKWQMAWSNLLNAGIVINPPVRAICLMDYINKVGVNRKGQFIEASNHFTGNAVNIGGGGNGVNDERKVIEKAMPHIPQIVSIVVERENNAIHLNCKP